MPKVAKQKTTRKLIHPNSRKANQIGRMNNRNQDKMEKTREKALKLNRIATKLLWFQNNLDGTVECYEQSALAALVEKYLRRFDDEMEQINIVRSIGHRDNNQHTGRERAIKFAQDRESMLYTSTGLDIPDLLRAKALKAFKAWNGDLKELPRLPMIKFRKPKTSSTPA